MIAATATGYITLLALDARLMVLEDTVVARQQALKFARDRAEVGYTSQLELRQAEAEYQAAVQLVPQLRAQIARQENALAVLSGDLPGTVDRGGTLDNLRQPAAPSTLPSELLRRRPDIAVAEYRLAAADAQIRAARAQFMPSINLGASAGIAISDLLADPITLWSVGGSVLAPIFQGDVLPRSWTPQLHSAIRPLGPIARRHSTRSARWTTVWRCSPISPNKRSRCGPREWRWQTPCAMLQTDIEPAIRPISSKSTLSARFWESTCL